MEYSIKEVSKMAGVSTRTLRYYDEIGLLKPAGMKESGYRFYKEEELELLQQILFYKERGMKLLKIKEIIYNHGFDTLLALQEHLGELEKQQERTEKLIINLKHTIASMKGERKMSQTERFEAFKQEMIKENEEKYGEEIREKYTEETINESNRKMLSMTEEEYNKFTSLEVQIKIGLQTMVEKGIGPKSQEARQLVAMHKEWLKMTWKSYSAAAHKGVAQMYVEDERFRLYYDKEQSGCAKLLRDAICFYVKDE